MVNTQSEMLALGTEAPQFQLPDPSGQMHSLDDFAGSKAYLVVFMCNHCPFVKHVRSELAALGKYCEQNAVGMIGINPNDAEKYPDDRPDQMQNEAEAQGYVFPYVVDLTQEVAKAYRAACTPDFYLFDAHRKLVYRGQLDDSRPGNGVPVAGTDVRAAIAAVTAGTPVSQDQKPSLGCNIKWREGNAPDYFG